MIIRKNVSAIIVFIALLFLIGCSRQSQSNQNSSNTAAQNTNAGNKSNQPNLTTVSDKEDASHWEQITSSFSIMGRVTKSEDLSNSKPESPRYQYGVLVRVKNIGQSSIDYSETELSFIPTTGEPLQMVQTSRDIKNQSKIKIETLKNGEEKEWVLDTNGYTDDLLSRSKDKPLIFEITIKNKGKTVGGTFQAELPNINDLPLIKEGQPKSAVYLKFKAK